MGDGEESGCRPRYKWPRVMLAFLLVGVALAIAWMSAEVRRLREYRDPDPLAGPAGRQSAPPDAGTNPIPPVHQLPGK